jgi:hypothetical protein
VFEFRRLSSDDGKDERMKTHLGRADVMIVLAHRRKSGRLIYFHAAEFPQISQKSNITNVTLSQSNDEVGSIIMITHLSAKRLIVTYLNLLGAIGEGVLHELATTTV